MEQRAMDTLQLAFKNRANGVCHITSTSEAEVALINLDLKNSRKLFNAFQSQYPNTPAVGICAEKSDSWDIKQIQIPLSVNSLVTVIMEATMETSVDITMELDITEDNKLTSKITEDKIALAMKAIESRNVAKKLNSRVTQKKSNKASQRVVPTKTDEMCFSSERFLLGHVLDAIKSLEDKNESILLTCWGDKNIFINPQKSEIITNLTDNQIRNLAIAPTDDKLSSPISIERHNKDSLKKINSINTKKMRVFTQEVFMWNLGLMTSRGRIPQETSINVRLCMRRWPNLTRVIIPENAMRIVAYWVRNPCSIMDIHEKLNLPLQDIFTIYTAANSAALITVAKRDSDQLIKTETLYDNDKRGLFTSIVNRLRLFGNDKKVKSAKGKYK